MARASTNAIQRRAALLNPDDPSSGRRAPGMRGRAPPRSGGDHGGLARRATSKQAMPPSLSQAAPFASSGGGEVEHDRGPRRQVRQTSSTMAWTSTAPSVEGSTGMLRASPLSPLAPVRVPKGAVSARLDEGRRSAQRELDADVWHEPAVRAGDRFIISTYPTYRQPENLPTTASREVVERDSCRAVGTYCEMFEHACAEVWH